MLMAKKSKESYNNVFSKPTSLVLQDILCKLVKQTWTTLPSPLLNKLLS